MGTVILSPASICFGIWPTLLFTILPIFHSDFISSSPWESFAKYFIGRGVLECGANTQGNIRHRPAIAAWFRKIAIRCFHIFSSSYFTTSSVKVTSAEDCSSSARENLLPMVGKDGYFWRLSGSKVMLQKWVSCLPILTVLGTLTPQGFFTRALGLGVRKRQAALLLRAVLLPVWLGWLCSP